MRRYVIERDLQGAGEIPADQLGTIRQASNAALKATGGVQWVQSFITADRIYCHYLAEDEQKVREHAMRAGIPCTKVSEVRSVVDPLTATLQRV